MVGRHVRDVEVASSTLASPTTPPLSLAGQRGLRTFAVCFARQLSRARSRLNAALMSPRWVKAWGKLPRASPLGPISSA